VLIESRSVDFIPLNERHGKPWQQFPFWFSAGCGLTSAAAGFVGPLLGLGLVWSLIAVILGMGFGTVFMALHANQGPRLGIPQMIQSRAQFGRRGAIFSFVLATFTFFVSLVVGAVFARSMFNDVFAVHVGTWFYFPFMALVLLVPLVGHDLIHFVNRWTAYLSVVVFGILTVMLILFAGDHPMKISAGGFSGIPFLLTFAASVSYQLVFVVYTSDYTRYLPANVSVPRLIGFVYGGATTGALWLACLGVVIASFITDPDPIGSVQLIGNTELSGYGTFILGFELIAFVIGNSYCVYGSVLSIISTADSVRELRHPTSRRLRVTVTIAVALVAAVIETVSSGDLENVWNTAYSLALYFLIPWTAVNLVDYYLVRRGSYSIRDILKASSVYGQWNWRGLAAYVTGVACMVPFWVLSFFTGPAASALGGVDISWAVGLAVSGVLYYALARGAAADVTVVGAAEPAISLERN
jgi:nucleobase:cation symporter-1, NCS1 family